AKHEAQFDKFLRDYIQEDAFERLELDPKAFFSMKAALSELQSPHLSETKVALLTQVESYFNQFGKDLQMLINNREQADAQK
ncbi:hypothetical protein A2U01_0090627, partial [Trifolium medium]|nr:hypothetical protein [Trifolium medium]